MNIQEVVSSEYFEPFGIRHYVTRKREKEILVGDTESVSSRARAFPKSLVPNGIRIRPKAWKKNNGKSNNAIRVFRSASPYRT